VPDKTYKTEYCLEVDVVSLHGDCNDSLKNIPDESIQLIISSPPYLLKKEYEDKTKTFSDYVREMKPLIEEMRRILSPTGSICWQVGNYIHNGEVYPLDTYFYFQFKAFDFRLRNRVIWHFGHGLHASKRFSGRYETLLWFTKTDDYIFNLDPIRVPSKYPGKRHYKGEKKGKPSGNPLGKNPSDIWEIVAQDWETGLWDIPNVKANHPEKTDHPCQFPVELVQRCVLALTDVGDTVLDPFSGVGSAMIGAVMHDRKAILCEQDEKYIAVAKQRLEDFNTGILRVRPLGKSVHKPTGKERVAQVPVEWLESKTQEVGE
jgi:adenine-specific DNA-methyltransferase